MPLRVAKELMELEKQEGSPLPAHLLEKKTFIQTKLLRVMEEEEIYWHKWSNLNWLLQGDNTTKFFYRVANGKKKEEYDFSSRI
jgi:hypothetical protein